MRCALCGSCCSVRSEKLDPAQINASEAFLRLTLVAPSTDRKSTRNGHGKCRYGSKDRRSSLTKSALVSRRVFQEHHRGLQDLNRSKLSGTISRNIIRNQRDGGGKCTGTKQNVHFPGAKNTGPDPGAQNVAFTALRLPRKESCENVINGSPSVIMSLGIDRSEAA